MHEISSLFSGKNKKNIIDMSSAEFAHSMVSVEAPVTTAVDKKFYFSEKARFDSSCKLSA